ncbi:MAG: hypothetical protein ACJAYU_002014 [Bradymonadia bacterium]|jgi:hypothetical protein
MRFLVASFLIVLLSGCSAATFQVQNIADEFDGRQVYVGHVNVKDEHEFTYIRAVQELGNAGQIARHTTSDERTDRVLVIHEAESTLESGLVRFVEDHRQLGRYTHVTVEAGELVLVQHTERGTRTRREDVNDPVIAGPTLIPFLRSEWARLETGERVPIQFIVPDRLRTYRFETVYEEVDSTCVVSLRPMSALVRVLTPRIAVVFDCETRLELEYHGPIPPVDTRGRSLNGAVDYEQFVEDD